MASASVERYVPTSSLAPYREIMNSAGVQGELLRRAEQVASAAGANGVECVADVRAGRKRAHARATAGHMEPTGFRQRGHNLKVDRILQASLDAARG